MAPADGELSGDDMRRVMAAAKKTLPKAGDDLSLPSRAAHFQRINANLVENQGTEDDDDDDQRLKEVALKSNRPDLAVAQYTAADAKIADYSLSNDVQLFVIWHNAMEEYDRILDDIRSRFVVLAVSLFQWPGMPTPDGAAMPSEERDKGRQRFEDNLWRLYSGKGGWARTGMKLKVKQCGFGPFIAVVVLDPEPQYRDEKTAHGMDRVNHKMNDAKKEYRTWTGGGFKVHGTFSRAEARHDIPFLFHRDAADFLRMYRESKGASAHGVADRFLAFMHVNEALRETSLFRRGAAAGVGLRPRGMQALRLRGEAEADAVEVWSQLLSTEVRSEVRIDGGRQPGVGKSNKASNNPFHKSPFSVAYKWGSRPRPAPEIEVHPLGGQVAAESMRTEGVVDEWLLVPMRTGYEFMGADGYRNCRQLLTMLRGAEARLQTHPGQPEDPIHPVGMADAECPTWPSDIEVVMGKKHLWAVAAAIGGKAKHDSGLATDPPGEFVVTIGRTPYNFYMRPTDRKYAL